MEYKKCPNCGAEVPSGFTICSNCGGSLLMDGYIEEENYPKVRNRFVTFWLWFCLVVNGLSTIFFFGLMNSSKGLYSATPEPFILQLLWLVSSLVNVLCYWLLLSWKKIGFSILCGVSLINGVISACVELSFFPILSAVIPLFILFRILQMTKDDLSCWEQMS